MTISTRTPRSLTGHRRTDAAAASISEQPSEVPPGRPDRVPDGARRPYRSSQSGNRSEVRVTLIGASATVRSFFADQSGISSGFPGGRVGEHARRRNDKIGTGEGGTAGPQRRAGGHDVVDED